MTTFISRNLLWSQIEPEMLIIENNQYNSNILVVSFDGFEAKLFFFDTTAGPQIDFVQKVSSLFSRLNIGAKIIYADGRIFEAR